MLTQTEIAAKIRKLLALADGAGTEAEAANAAARAAALMAQYQIEQADVDELVRDAEDPMVRVDSESSGRLAGWRKQLASGIAAGCGCSVILVRSRRAGETTLSFFGRTSDVQAAVYMFGALSTEIERLARRNAAGNGAAYVNAYKLGAATTINRRLRAQREETIEQAREAGVSSAALVKVNDSCAIAHKFAERALGKIGSSAPSRYSSGGGFQAGQKDGRDVKLGGGAALGKGQRAIGTGR
jgi:hypothetical protein